MAKLVFNAGVFFNEPLYPAPSSTVVTVTHSATGAIASIWNDRDGASPRSNPFLLGADGVLSFYANAGRYNIIATNGGLSRTWSDVLLIDPDVSGLGGPETTDELPEGSSNLYFTSFRAANALTGAISNATLSNFTPSRAVVTDVDGKFAPSIVTATELNYLSGVTSNIQTQLNAPPVGITGAATTILTDNLTASRALVSNSSGKVAVSAVTSTELAYVSGVTSAIQGQINAKQATITGAATTVTSSNLTASRATISNASGKLDVSAVTTTELGYLSGVTSAIQTQLGARELLASKGAANGYAPLGADSKVAAIYLPSYVDDVLEFANLAAFPVTGTTGIMYVTQDTNRVYRWSGSAYVEISPSPGSTDAVPEGATNLYFTNARAQSAITGAASTVTTSNLTASRVAISNGSGKLDASTVTTTVLGYIGTLTSDAQAQINNRVQLTGATGQGVLGGLNITANGDTLATSLATAHSNAASYLRPLQSVSSMRLTWGATGNTTTYLQVLNNGGTSAWDLALNPYGGAVTINGFTPWHSGNVTGAASTVMTSNLTANRAAVVDANGKLAAHTAALGTAAAATLTTASYSITAGQVIKVGDYGIGVGQTFTNVDMNTLTAPGIYAVDSTSSTNTPITLGAFIVTVAAGNASGTNNRVAQEAVGISSNVEGRKFVRTLRSGWTAWSEIYTSATDGAGSGLDADTVDGIQASAFVRGDTTTTQTMAAILLINNRSIIGQQTLGNVNNLSLIQQHGNTSTQIQFGGITNVAATATFDGNTQTLTLAPSGVSATNCHLTVTGNATAVDFISTSSRRFKTDIATLTVDGDAFDALRPVTYVNIADGAHKIGLIAEEVEPLYPEFVMNDPDGQARGLDYAKMVALLIAEVQDLRSRVAKLEGF